MIDLADILKAMTLAGAATEAAQSLVKTVSVLFSDDDKATLEAALADVRAENDAGHAALQAKLAAAAKL